MLLLTEQVRIAFFQVFEKERLRYVGELAVIDEVLHQLRAIAVEGMKNTVVDPVEFQRRHIEQVAEFPVERWRRLDPAILQIKLGVAVHGEHVALEQLKQPWRRQMIAHIRQADPRGNPAMPRRTGQQRGLGDAVTLPGRQCMTAAQGLRIATECVRVVAHRFAHGVIETDCLLNRIATGATVFFGELHHGRMVTIDEAAGTQILVHENNLLGKPRV